MLHIAFLDVGILGDKSLKAGYYLQESKAGLGRRIQRKSTGQPYPQHVRGHRERKLEINPVVATLLTQFGSGFIGPLVLLHPRDR